MNNCKNCPVNDGYKPAEAVHEIAEPKTQQPEALRLADCIDPIVRPHAPDHLTSKVAADELRRQHARITELEDTTDIAIERIAELEAQLEADTNLTKKGLDVIAGAIALCKHAAKIQNIDFDDYWAIHSNEFKEEAKLVLDAAQAKQGGA